MRAFHPFSANLNFPWMHTNPQSTNATRITYMLHLLVLFINFYGESWSRWTVYLSLPRDMFDIALQSCWCIKQLYLILRLAFYSMEVDYLHMYILVQFEVRRQCVCTLLKSTANYACNYMYVVLQICNYSRCNRSRIRWSKTSASDASCTFEHIFFPTQNCYHYSFHFYSSLDILHR